MMLQARKVSLRLWGVYWKILFFYVVEGGLERWSMFGEENVSFDLMFVSFMHGLSDIVAQTWTSMEHMQTAVDSFNTDHHTDHHFWLEVNSIYCHENNIFYQTFCHYYAQNDITNTWAIPKNKTTKQHSGVDSLQQIPFSVQDRCNFFLLGQHWCLISCTTCSLNPTSSKNVDNFCF